MAKILLVKGQWLKHGSSRYFSGHSGKSTCGIRVVGSGDQRAEVLTKALEKKFDKDVKIRMNAR